jgi:DNA-binding NtrC family response regulator
MSTKERVLIVDDQRELCEFLLFILKDKFAVSTACAAEEAFIYMAEHSVDLILLDFMMPGIDGITALAEIKKNYSDTEVIMMTGFAPADTIRTAFSLGAFAFLTKPLDIDKLIDTIDEALRKRTSRKSGQISGNKYFDR